LEGVAVSATTSLFASFAIAALGAAGLAYSLGHPGFLASSAARLLTAAGVSIPQKSTRPHIQVAEERVTRPEGDAVTIPAGDFGHFNTEAEINGRSVDVMVDTGASLVALTYEDAERAGVFVRPSDFNRVALTANGQARVAPVMISEISIGDVSVRNVQAVVSERGASERTLLGMSFLGRLARVEMRAGTLVLQQ
jgi:aspartyl protease family protein